MIRNLFAVMKPCGLLTGVFMFLQSGVVTAQAPGLYGTISGKVWEERTPVNGIFDQAETTYAGFLVRMNTTTIPVRTIASALVDANGNYVLQHYEGPGNYVIQLYYPYQAFVGLAQTAATLPGSQSHFKRLGNNTTVTTTVSAPGQNIVLNAALIRNEQYQLSCAKFSDTVNPSVQPQLSLSKFDYTAAGVFLLDLNLWSAVSSFHDHVVIEESQNNAAQMQARVGLQTSATWPDTGNMSEMYAQAATTAFVVPVNASETRHFYNVNNSAVLPLSNLNYAPLNTGAGTMTVPVTLSNSVTITGAMNFVVTSLPTLASCGTCLVYYTSPPLNLNSLNNEEAK
ncbi:MAG: hypothetical protein EOP54_01950 [Sphingobacteriales bacterium]|nr:MAG: hypothetical protein EOP54_01950 [Sphingobacteriales bacterium]